MKRETYREQAMANLHAMSRTANGTVDTSASADKKDKLAVSDGETAKSIALHNYEDALTCDTDRFARYFRHMLQKGIYLAPSQFEAVFVSAVHTEKDLQKTADAIRTFREA